MKKALFLITVLFALSIGFGSNNEVVAQNDITTIVYHVGDVKMGSSFTVNYSGSFVAIISPTLTMKDTYTFMIAAHESFSPGNNVHIGDILVNQNGKQVVYQIRANVKS